MKLFKNLLPAVLMLMVTMVLSPERSSAATVSGVQTGSAVSNGNGTIVVPIAAVVPASSFLIFNTRHTSNRPPGSMLRGRLASPTTLEFTRVTNETAAITFDAQSGNSGSSVSTISWSHTIGTASNRKLIVGVSAEQGDLSGAEVVTGVTYNGVALTFARAASVATTNNFVNRTEIWYLDENQLPPSGSATIQVNFTGTVRDINAGAISLAGAEAGAPEATAANTNVATASITTPITTLTNGAWIIDVVGSGNGGNYTPGGGQTERWDLTSPLFTSTGAASTKIDAVAGPNSMMQTHNTASLRTTHVVISIAPAQPRIDIEWSVVEFSAGVNVQRGSVNQTGTVVNVPIAAVGGLNQAFVTWSKTPSAGDNIWSNDDPIVGELTTPANLQFRVDGTNAGHVIWWQVIEFTNPADINVQKGTLITMTGATTSVTATLGTPVNVNTTFVLASFRGPGSGADVGRRMMRARLTNSTTITFDRGIGGFGDNMTEIVWQAIDLRDGSTVQHASENFAQGVAQKLVAISAVDTNRSVAFASVQPVGGQNMGRSPYAGDDIIGVGSVTMALAPTQITMTRNNTKATADIGWFVVEFGPGTPSQPYILSTESGATLGGLGFQDEDLVEYDPGIDVATMFFDGSTVYSANEDTDAAHVLTTGHIALSPENGAQIGALNFQDEDIVDYDPGTGTATMMFDGSTIFSANEDIDAVFVRSNGHILLSTENAAQIGALNFQDEDIVDYDPGTGTATMFFDGSTVFTANEDVDGFHILSSGNYLLSTVNGAQIGALTFTDGDVVEYNPGTGVAALFFNENNFSANEDVDAITIDIPPNVVDHYAISHSGLGVTCEAEPVTIRAHDVAHLAIAPGITTTITGSTSPNADLWALRVGAGVFTDIGGGQFTYTFAAGETEVGLWLTRTTVAVIDIDIVDGSGNTEDGSEDPSLDFRDTGFRFYADGVANTIGTQISRKENTMPPGVQAMTLRAVRTSTDTGACEARLMGAQMVEMAFECDNPNTCIGGQDVTVTGAPSVAIPGNPDGSVTSYTNVNLLFDATGTAPFTFNYTDAGRIALHARKTLAASPPDPAITLTGASNDFVVSPAGLCVESTDANSDCASGDATCFPFVKAGTPAFAESRFNLTISAVGWETGGETNFDFCTGNIVTPNFQLNTIVLTHAKISPNPLGVLGALGVLSFDMVAADSGQHTVANQAISEVGVFTITAEPPAYLGQTIGDSDSDNIGRFYPDRFNIMPNAPTFADSCVAGTPFTYIDETFYYGTPPALMLEAVNTAGARTNNYGGTGVQRFWKLSTLLPGRIYFDQAIGSAWWNAPTLNGTVTLSDDTDYDGDGTLTMDAGMAGDAFSYQRVVPEQPFPALADLTIPAADLRDDDLVCYDPDNDDTCDDFDIIGIGGTEMRFGRLLINNAFGSELLDLSVRATTQYYQNTALGFVVHANDVCTDTTLGLSNFTGNLSAGETCVQDIGFPGLSGAGCPAPGPVAEQFAEPPVAGDFNLFLRAPLAGNDGSVDVEGILPAWLRYDWDGIDQGGDGYIWDDNPVGRATFGIFKGNTRHIYLRELY